MTPPKATIVVPAYNVQATIAQTIAALLAQTFVDFEIIVVDDGSPDASAKIAARSGDARVRIVTQANRGLAGARNTGIAMARGAYIGFCDADDLWAPGKLAAHIAHLDANPRIGISYSGSALIDDASRPLGLSQRPRLTGVTAAHVFKRNPIGNGSAPVIRRAALDAIAFAHPETANRTCWFDESFRQSEDIECWLRLMLTGAWAIEGVPGDLTLYRVNSGGLSAATDRQLAAWERMVAKLAPRYPAFFARHTPAARAYQLRYLARRAISDHNGPRAAQLARAAFAASRVPLVEEPLKTLSTFAAAAAISLIGARGFAQLRSGVTATLTLLKGARA